MKIEVITIVVITILSTYECKQQNNTNLPNDEDLKMKWISENLMELTLYDGEIKNVTLVSSQDNQPDIDGALDCVWTGRIEGDKSSIISVIGCMDSAHCIKGVNLRKKSEICGRSSYLCGLNVLFAAYH